MRLRRSKMLEIEESGMKEVNNNENILRQATRIKFA